GASTAQFTLQHVNGAFASQVVTITAARPGSSRTANVTALGANSSFVSQYTYPKMFAGESYDVSFTFKNTGGTTWTPGLNYKLQSKNPVNNTTWGFNRINMGAGASTAPNQDYQFNATVIAPLAAATYNMQWGSWLDAIGIFGASSTNVAVQV